MLLIDQHHNWNRNCSWTLLCLCVYLESVRLTVILSSTLSQTSPVIYVSAVKAFWKHRGIRRNCSWRAISSFHTAFSTLSANFSSFLSKLKLPSASSISFEKSKIGRLGRVKILQHHKCLAFFQKKLLDPSRLRVSADNKSEIFTNKLGVFDTLETAGKRWGKKRKTVYQHFIPLSKMFLKSS